MEPVLLYNPNFITLDDAYRSLPNLGEVHIKAENPNQILHDLEKTGFVACKVISSSDNFFTVQAFKGKHGPCRYSGWKARYTGAALAALDDDNHLLFSDSYSSVCEKTANIYILPPYQDLIDCRLDESSDLFNNQENSMGNPGDFEENQAALFYKLSNEKDNAGPRKELYYPGPFRFLFLQDGTIIRRGKMNHIPEEQAIYLMRHDGFLTLNLNHHAQLAYFQEEYSKKGPAFLMEDFMPTKIFQPAYQTDFSKLALVGKKTRTRLLNIIKDQKKYFILTGSDINDRLGCCPSVEVTEANQLVKYGILSALSDPVQAGTCPVTIYSFKNEITTETHDFSSTIDDVFREKVRVFLEKPTRNWQILLKWVLLLFVLVSTALATLKWYEMQNTEVNISLSSLLNPANENQVQVILFHNQKRCFQCLQMEKYCREIWEVPDTLKNPQGELTFKTIVIDDPANYSLVKYFGIFSPTVVFLKFEKKELVNSKVLFEATGLYREKDKFQAFLKSEWQLFNETDND